MQTELTNESGRVVYGSSFRLGRGFSTPRLCITVFTTTNVLKLSQVCLLEQSSALILFQLMLNTVFEFSIDLRL